MSDLQPRIVARGDTKMPAELTCEWNNWFWSLDSWCRKERGRKAELARRLGVSRQRFNHWMRNGRTMPGWAVVAIQNYFHSLRPLFDIYT